MDHLKSLMIEKAISEHKKIYPSGNHKDFHESFTLEEGALLFWYNTEDESTHLMVKKINE